jgi:hypothetical protein
VPTRTQDESTRSTTWPCLRNLHPRKSGWRLQFSLGAIAIDSRYIGTSEAALDDLSNWRRAAATPQHDAFPSLTGFVPLR